MTNPPPTALAKLRHAYAQLVSGAVNDPVALAKGLIGPAIEQLERAARDAQGSGE